VFDDWSPGTYYVVIWAVDEWGNARYACYEVKDPPNKLTTSRISTTNWGSVWDPEYDMYNYYYVLDGSPHGP